MGVSYPLPELRDLAGALAAGDQDLAIGGIVPAARSLAVAGLVAGGWSPGRCLIVVPHVAEAAELAAGLALLAPALKVGVVPAEGASPTEEELMEFIQPKLAKYKWPSEIEFRDELPKTNVGKVLKKELRAEMAAGKD